MKKLRCLILSLISILMFTPLQSFAAEDYLAYVWDSSNNKWVNALAYQINVNNDTKEVKGYIPQGYANFNDNETRDNIYFLYATASNYATSNWTTTTSRTVHYESGVRQCDGRPTDGNCPNCLQSGVGTIHTFNTGPYDETVYDTIHHYKYDNTITVLGKPISLSREFTSPQSTVTYTFTTINSNDSKITVNTSSRTWIITVDIDKDGRADYTNSGKF